MPKTPSSRLFFAVVVLVLVSIIGRNLYRRYLNNALIHAVESRNVAQVRSLLEKGADANTKKPSEIPKTPDAPLLRLAIDRSTTGSPTGLVQMSPQQEIACLLIQHGADFRNVPNGYSSYLQNACYSGSPPVVRCLLEHGADPNFSGHAGSTALDDALSYGMSGGLSYYGAAPQVTASEAMRRDRVSREMIDLLQQHGARISAVQAVELDDAALLRAALASGANVNKQRQNAVTALRVAAAKGSLPLMDMLLKAGANPDITDTYSGPALNAAVGHGRDSLAAVKLLLAHGAKVNVVGTNFDPPLVTAITCKRADITRLLLAHNADPNLERATDNNASSALAAAARSLPELVPDLLAHHADINVGSGAALHAAIRARNTHLVRYLLARGAKTYPAITKPTLTTTGTVTNSKSQLTFSVTPSTLQTAVIYDPECFELLLHAGADIAPEKAGILLTAASAGQATLFDRLIALGANVNAVDAQGNTTLTEATRYAPAGVQTLLEHGVNPNAVTQGQTPLLIAVQKGDTELVRLLFAYSANPNTVAQGQTPLLMAVQRQNTDMVRLLLTHDSNPNLKPPRGHTPLYFARRRSNAAIVRMLEQAGAKAE